MLSEKRNSRDTFDVIFLNKVLDLLKDCFLESLSWNFEKTSESQFHRDEAKSYLRLSNKWNENFQEIYSGLKEEIQIRDLTKPLTNIEMAVIFSNVLHKTLGEHFMSRKLKTPIINENGDRISIIKYTQNRFEVDDFNDLVTAYQNYVKAMEFDKKHPKDKFDTIVIPAMESVFEHCYELTKSYKKIPEDLTAENDNGLDDFDRHNKRFQRFYKKFKDVVNQLDLDKVSPKEISSVFAGLYEKLRIPDYVSLVNMDQGDGRTKEDILAMELKENDLKVIADAVWSYKTRNIEKAITKTKKRKVFSHGT